MAKLQLNKEQGLYPLIWQYIEQHKSELQDLLTAYASEPETGFKEQNTGAKFLAYAEELGLQAQTGLALTGIKVRLCGKNKQVGKFNTVAIIGELDAIPCPNQKHFPVATSGATHACGHAVQMAVLTLLMRFFAQPDIVKQLTGDLVFFAVPAEELIELDFRQQLVDQGLIKHMGGKQELISIGAFADIDAAIMFHSLPDLPDNTVVLQSPAMGFISKTVHFHGQSSHAAGAPDQGINALSAANLAWQAVQALREGFRDQDSVRVHGVVTNGGGAVNVIPDLISYEFVVRAKTVEAMQAINSKVNRALTHSALALGAEAEIIDREGYLPLLQSVGINKIIKELAEFTDINVLWGDDFPGSTDLGDLAMLLPVAQVSVGGYRYPLHSENFQIVDFKNAVMDPCYLLAGATCDLLAVDDLRQFLATDYRYTVSEYADIWQSILGGV